MADSIEVHPAEEKPNTSAEGGHGAQRPAVYYNIQFQDSPVLAGDLKGISIQYHQEYHGPTTRTTRQRETPTETQDRTVMETSEDSKFVYSRDLLQDSGVPSVGEDLINAAAVGNVKKVREIIDSHPDEVTFQNKQGQTALHAAAYSGHKDVAIALVTGKAPLEAKDANGDTPLSFAVAGDEPDIVKYLLESGSNVNSANNKGFTPLHRTAFAGHLTSAEVLLEHEGNVCDVNMKDTKGNSPLFIAIQKKNEEITKLLVQDQRVNFQQKNTKGFNCLHHAAMSTNNIAVQNILEVQPTLINVATSEGFTGLHIAALNGLTDVMLTLVKQEICDKDYKSVKGHTPLHLAVDKCREKCIEILVDSGANVNAQDEDGDTSLHIIVMKTSTSMDQENDEDSPSLTVVQRIISFLIGHPKVNFKMINNKGFNCLHFAALKGNKFAVEKIVEVAPDMINTAKKDGFTALHVATVNGYADIVLTLIKQGQCKKDPKNINGQTPLHVAVDKCHTECIKALLDNGADVNARDKDGDTTLHLLILEASKKNIVKGILSPTLTGAEDSSEDSPSAQTVMEIMELLTENPKLNVGQTNNKGFNCLHQAAFWGNNVFVERILRAKPWMINTTTSDNFTALHIAAINGKTDIVLTLVKQEQCMKDIKSVLGQTPLHLAVEECYEKCIEALMENGADVNAQDNDGDTSLHNLTTEASKTNSSISRAIRKAKDKDSHSLSDLQHIIGLFTTHKQVNFRLENNKGFNCLHHAAFSGNKFAVEKILEADPSLINIQKNDGFTALHIAAINGHTDILLTLAKQDTCERDLKSVAGQSPLHLAVDENHNKCIEALIKSGADVNSQDKNGDTGLHLAIQTSKKDTVKGLLSAVLMEGINKDTSSSLDKQKIIELFVEHPAFNPKVMNNKGFNCLHQAAFDGDTFAAERILQADSTMTNVLTNEGCFTALHIAAINDRADILLNLVKQETCDKDAKSASGQTPLHLAVEKSHKKCIDALVNNGADVNAQDKDGDTSLHLLVTALVKDTEENSSTIQQIIKMLAVHPKIDLKLENYKGFNCVHHAALCGSNFATEILVKADPSLINIAKNDGFTALHLAAFNGFTDIVLTLVKQENCDKDLQTDDGHTALHLAVSKGYKKIVEALVNGGANVNLQDKDGDTCLHLVTMKASLKSILSSTSAVEKGTDTPLLLDLLKNINQIIHLLVEHPRTNHHLQNNKGFNCLHYAAIHGNNFAVGLIVRAEPSIINIVHTRDKSTPLHLAALNGHTDVVQTLVNQETCVKDVKNSNGQTPLHVAVDKCHFECIKALINSGADINTKDNDGDTCLHLLVKKMSLSNDEDAQSELHIPETMELFLEKADLKLTNSNGDNCLHYAAIAGADAAVRRILKADPSLISTTRDNLTAMHLAAFGGHADVVLTIIKQGSWIKDLQNSSGQAALHIAVEKGHYGCIEVLVSNGANVNAQDKKGNTSLHLVMMNSATKDILNTTPSEKLLELAQQTGREVDTSEERVKLVATATRLIKGGANIDLVNSDRNTVLDIINNLDVGSDIKEFFERSARAAAANDGSCTIS